MPKRRKAKDPENAAGAVAAAVTGAAPASVAVNDAKKKKKKHKAGWTKYKNVPEQAKADYPTKPLSGYMLYCKHRRGEDDAMLKSKHKAEQDANPGKEIPPPVKPKVTDSGRKYGEEWDQISDAAKAPWLALAKAASEAFPGKIEAWRQKYTLEKIPDKPKKPMTGFLLFSQSVRPTYLVDEVALKAEEKKMADLAEEAKKTGKAAPKTNVKFTLTSRGIGQNWKALSKAEQQVWNDKAKAATPVVAAALSA